MVFMIFQARLYANVSQYLRIVVELLNCVLFMYNVIHLSP